MNMTKILVLLSTLFFSLSLHAGQCESAKSATDNKCDPEQLAGIKSALDAQTAMYQGNVGATGTAKMTEDQIAHVNEAMSKNAVFQTDCGKAIKACSDTCIQEKTQAEGLNDQATALSAENNRKQCTEGKPKQVADEAARNQGSMGQTLAGLGQLLSALTGLIKPGEKTASTDECTVSATNTAAMVQANTNCSTDAASASAGTTFASGDYRTAKGLVSATDSLGTGEVGMGVGAKQEFAPASAGGGGGGSSSGMGMGGRMSSASASGNPNSKDEKSLPASNFSGSGGGGGKSASGSGGSSGKPGAYGQITKASIDDERLMQSAVDKAMQQRGPAASEGPPGGISSAFSLDNFIKVEKRMQNERNLLNEL